MAAQPWHDNPDDPMEILQILPDEYHGQFLDDYYDALDTALRPEEFCTLLEMLHLWRLRAVAYSRPGYADRLESARSGDSADFVPAQQVV